MAKRTTLVLASVLLVSGMSGGVLAACGGDSTTIGSSSLDGGSEGSVTAEAGAGSDSGGAVDSGSTDDGSMSMDSGDTVDGGDAGQCNTLKAPATDIAVTFGGEPPPTPQGGVIVPGTYKLSKVVLYGAQNDSGVPDSGTSPVLERGEIVFGVTTYDVVTVISVGGAGTTRRDADGTYAVNANGKSIDFTETCPKAATPKAGFTVEGTSITLYRPETIAGKDYIAGMTYGP